jgi:4-diphosphocytidyl-2-C-methyl-D-erythritol kinase
MFGQECNLPSPAKVNITLRIVSKRANGYHDLVSTFIRIDGVEEISIKFRDTCDGKDVVQTYNIRIDGENLINSTLSFLRKRNLPIPPLEVKVWKRIPPGSGLGGGSGNAASILHWAKSRWGGDVTPMETSAIGADVPFLFSGYRAALVRKIGDDFTPIEPLEGYAFLFLIPNWRVPTTYAFSKLDQHYASSGWPMDEGAAIDETLELLNRLKRGDRVGLLPNDFLPALAEHSNAYEEIFRSVENTGALAWGLSGSGSAAFAIFEGSCEAQRSKQKLSSCGLIDRIMAFA